VRSAIIFLIRDCIAPDQQMHPCKHLLVSSASLASSNAKLHGGISGGTPASFPECPCRNAWDNKDGRDVAPRQFFPARSGGASSLCFTTTRLVPQSIVVAAGECASTVQIR